jgi:hypothetical protein
MVHGISIVVVVVAVVDDAAVAAAAAAHTVSNGGDGDERDQGLCGCWCCGCYCCCGSCAIVMSMSSSIVASLALTYTQCMCPLMSVRRPLTTLGPPLRVWAMVYFHWLC